ncbi:hypothetical protein LX99_05118 [Mucilaginibacter oryzae]|uniref:Uncharacterized protein n=1 Tax=Mucilaginibacter oryzae TaxID=468058 RepID=A0A316GPS0_9SPHI|nr:hypothetical protein [Mucilaginibacter oryzae]PWK63460.1 hypothetical protein LX99_05118 [Mucilaginibacter oryzae]
MESIKQKAENIAPKACVRFLFCFMLFAFSFQLTHAQSWDEWFTKRKRRSNTWNSKSLL